MVAAEASLIDADKTIWPGDKYRHDPISPIPFKPSPLDRRIC